jgi:hypothetical protein
LFLHLCYGFTAHNSNLIHNFYLWFTTVRDRKLLQEHFKRKDACQSVRGALVNKHFAAGIQRCQISLMCPLFSPFGVLLIFTSGLYDSISASNNHVMLTSENIFRFWRCMPFTWFLLELYSMRFPMGELYMTWTRDNKFTFFRCLTFYWFLLENYMILF